MITKNQIIASLYNEVTRCEYLFYSPIKGTIINRNEKLLANLDTIYINKKVNDNWIVDIEHYNENNQNNEAYFKKKIVGYGLLRKRNFLLKKKKYTYLYYDTLIVSRKYRKLKIGHKISNLRF